ncbi:unnamed protein product [Schistosoma curassoni]|uniref:CCHC-type domain-containing protein n=1 Tax=Schistosoma curassoni TaxID=6186 RepID=A0A183KY93_9TREM|nr:unnamed protein product [Schistosoma curassoni]
MNAVSTRNYKANHKGEIKFGKCLSCGKFHSRNSCALRSAKCLKCGKIGHIQSVCKATVHFASSISRSCNLDPNNLAVPNDHSCLSTISKVGRPGLIRETRRYFGSILSAIRKGWNAKRRLPVYLSKRDELSTIHDGILCLNDRVVIPPSPRRSVVEDLHSGNCVEKMKSLSRLTC